MAARPNRFTITATIMVDEEEKNGGREDDRLPNLRLYATAYRGA